MPAMPESPSTPTAPSMPSTPQDGFGASAPTAPDAPPTDFSSSVPGSKASGFPAPPGFPAAPGGFGAPQFGTTFTEESKAGLALGLSIGAAVCLLTGILSIISLPLGIAGFVVGNKEKKAIDAGTRDPSKRGMAVAAQVIGGVVAALGVLVTLFILLIVIGFAAGA